MNARRRVEIISDGAAVLRWILDELRPHAESDLDMLREYRDVERLLYELDVALDVDGDDRISVYTRDAGRSMAIDASEVMALAAWEERLASGEVGSRRIVAGATRARIDALVALRDLLGRYADREFMPPPDWFGVRERGADRPWSSTLAPPFPNAPAHSRSRPWRSIVCTPAVLPGTNFAHADGRRSCTATTSAVAGTVRSPSISR